MSTSYADTPIATQRLVARLRFRHLHLLVELQRGGSLRAAAGVLNLTQPALSKALDEIEGAFGFRLFVRSARGLTSTQQGATAIRGAVLLLAELAHVQAEAAAEPAITLLRIGAPPFVAQTYLPAILAQLLASEGRVRVQLQEERVPLLMQSMLAGQLDALITSHPTEMPEIASHQLRYEKLFDADFEVIAPLDHPLCRVRKVDWQRVATEHWIMPAPSSMVRRMTEEMFRREGVAPPLPVIESTGPVTNVQLVAAGLGLSAVPGATLRAGYGAGRVQRVRVQPRIPPNPVALIYRAGPDNPRLQMLRVALGLE